MALEVGVKIATNVGDFLRGMVTVESSMATLRKSLKSLRSDQEKTSASTRILTHELDKQAKAVRSLTLNYASLRRSLLTFAVRTAITSFTALVASLNSVGVAATALAGSFMNLGGALAIGGGAGIASMLQSMVVLKLAFRQVGHALTTTGKLHKTAMEKLTQPAKDFVNEIIDIRHSVRDLQLTAQKGLFPGVTRGLRDAQKLMPMFKQAIWDTSQTLGYLAERMGEMVARRGPLLKNFFARNTLTMQRFGVVAENFGAGFLEIFTAAAPLMGHMTKELVTFSNTFKEKTKDWRKGGQFTSFFKDLRESWDNWTSILGKTGKMLFNIWDGIQPVIHSTEKAIKSSMTTAEEWTKKNKPQIKEFFEESMKPMGAFLKAVGRLAQAWVLFSKIGNADAVRFFNALRTQVIPLLEQWFVIIDKKILPKVSDLFGALFKFLDAATPGFEGMLSAIGSVTGGLTILIDALTKVVDFGNQFGAVGSVIATAFSVGALVIGWKGLKTEMSLAFLLLRRYMGFASHKTPVSKLDLIRNIPFVPQASTVISATRNTATRFRERAELMQERGAMYRQHGGGWTRRNLRRNMERGLTDQMGGYWPVDQNVPPPPRALLPMYTGGRFIAGPGGTRPWQDRQGRWHSPGGAFSSPISQDSGGQWRTARGRFVRAPGIAEVEDRGMRSTPKSAPWLRMQGGEASRMFKAYEAQMEKSTKTGFLKGMKGVKLPKLGGGGGGQRGSMMAGMGGMLGGPLGIALLLAPFLPGIIKSIAPKRPEPVVKVEKLQGLLGSGGLNPAAERVHRQRGDTFNLQDSNRLRGFGSAIDKAIQSKDVENLDKLAAGLDSVGEASKNARTRGKLADLAKDIHAVAAQDEQKALDNLSGSFDNFAQRGDQSVGKVRDGLAVLQADINNKMPQTTKRGLKLFNEAMAQSFGAAAAQVKAGMDAGTIAIKSGTKEYTRLLNAQFRQLGFTKEQARNLARTGDPRGFHTDSGRFKGAGAAVGGYFLGNKGQKGRDSVPMNVNGEPVIAAKGEYVGIFNSTQQKAFDAMAHQTGHGSMEGFFRGNARPHHMSEGGIFSKGGIIKLGTKLEREGYDVSENPAFGGVHPVHTRGSLHYSGRALDINADQMKGGEKKNLDRLAKELTAEGWHYLWQVPGHFDHLHVDDLKGNGSVENLKPPIIKLPKTEGKPNSLTDLIVGTLGTVANIGQTMLTSAFNKSLAGGDTGTFDTGGAGKLSRAQIAGLMKAHGFPNNQIQTGVAVALAESGGDPDISNSIGATGLWQILLSAHPDVSRAQAIDPNFATSYAHRLWKQSGWQPWEAYTGADGVGSDGPYLKFLHQGFGGNRAAGGYVARASVKPPKLGTPPPTNDPVGEAPHDDPKKKKKKKDKKKKKKPYTHSVPMPSGGGAGSHLKPKKKHPRLKPRKRIKALIDKPFTDTDLTPDNLVDPITGEELDVTKAFMPFQFIKKWQNYIDNAQGRLTKMEGIHGLTDETAIVDLYNSEQHHDLDNYLTKILGIKPKDLDAWKDKNGDSLDVINTNGIVRQGIYVRGINQAVGEIDQELGIHNVEEIPLGFHGGIMSAMNWQQSSAKSVNTHRAIHQRRARLQKIKTAFFANVRLRKRLNKKMEASRKRSYTWKKAVRHNEGLITEWQHWKRDNVGETPGATRKANHEIDDLQALNKHLRRTKPKGVDADRNYQHDLDTYKQRGDENNLLVGERNATHWHPEVGLTGGGAAGINLYLLSKWREADDFKIETLATLKDTIPAEQLNISTLNKTREEWTGTHIEPKPIDRTATDADKDRLIELKKQAGIERLTAALLASTQTDTLRGFAQSIGMRSVGAFAHGGLVGETGIALVHKGETISPDPVGPFRNGMNAPNNQGPPIVQVDLILRDRAGQLVELVDQRVRVVAPNAVSRKTGQRTRVIRAAGGGSR